MIGGTQEGSFSLFWRFCKSAWTHRWSLSSPPPVRPRLCGFRYLLFTPLFSKWHFPPPAPSLHRPSVSSVSSTSITCNKINMYSYFHVSTLHTVSWSILDWQILQGSEVIYCQDETIIFHHLVQKSSCLISFNFAKIDSDGSRCFFLIVLEITWLKLITRPPKKEKGSLSGICPADCPQSSSCYSLLNPKCYEQTLVDIVKHKIMMANVWQAVTYSSRLLEREDELYQQI